jgi:hypothetical protein
MKQVKNYFQEVYCKNNHIKFNALPYSFGPRYWDITMLTAVQ